ncbi:MAG: hypothetical protein HY426_04870 [Candidatus Levybacteria bacterium]|nr:hypothetical protein [Candidatus Levybacteria bacterium]
MRSPNYQFLKDKWTKRHKSLQKKLIQKHKGSFEWLAENSKQLAVGSLGSLLLLTSPLQKDQDAKVKVANESAQKIDTKTFLISDLSGILPDTIRPLTEGEEATISARLSKSYGISVLPQINGLRLDRSYGIIGAEQHLARFPGDNMATHFDGDETQASQYYSSGMAPGLGAWGYFTTSKASMTDEDKMREKYYIAVQTFLAPDFNQKVALYRDFFKFRKMLVVNPENGKGVVVVIGDAGPAEWSGKHLGGSPEVMKHLERVDGSMKGPVLYYFIDDPNDAIPLGPIEPIGNS